MRYWLILIVFFTTSLRAQTDSLLSFESYIEMVKKYHPLIAQADLIRVQADNMLMESKGAFDPKIYVGQNEKVLDDKIYFDRLDAQFKVPTWYGLEFSGGLDENQGLYLNPEEYTQNTNLYNIGVSLSVAKGLLMNDRMLAIKQAKIYQNQSEAERQLMINEVIYRASIAYFNWYKYDQEYHIYANYLSNAQNRLVGIRKNYLEGDKPAIDTTETRIALQNRKLQLEKASLMLSKAKLEVSNYLWYENNTPLELQEFLRPDSSSLLEVEQTLGIDNSTVTIDTHPKMRILEFKNQSLQAENKLYRYNMLPDIKVNYKLLTQTPLEMSSYDISNHASGISLSMPILLRKERGKLQQNRTKMLSLKLQQQNTSLQLQNKVLANRIAISSYQKQTEIFNELNADYETMLRGENRKFEIGESSVFMINSRESKLIENLIKAVDIRYNLYKEQSELYKNLGVR